MMKNKSLILISAAIFFLSGCAGNLYTYSNKDAACVKEDEKCAGKYKGVLYRPLIKHEETYIQDRILNAKGEVTHFSGAEGKKECVPTEVTEERLIPDPDNEYVVQYDSAFFETSTFSVKLSPLGTLNQVGTSSTPGGKALIESFIGLAATIKTLNHGVTSSSYIGDHSNKLLCSHGKISIPK